MSKLNEEELLVKLDYAFGSMSAYEGFDEAQQQIKEMIQKPEVTKKWIEEKMVEFFKEKYPAFPLGSDNLHITSFVLEFGIWLVKELPAKKPTVPKAFIENMTSRMEQMMMQKQKREDREYFIRVDVLRNAGVEEEE